MSILVLLPGPDCTVWVDRLAARLPGLDVVAPADVANPQDVDYVVTWAPPAGALRAFGNLKAVFSLSVGVDHILTDAALPDVPLVRIVDARITDRMCEYVLLHCLAHLRGYRRYADLQRRKQWVQDELQPAASEVRVGVMGLGVLGQAVMRTLGAIGFRVAGWARTRREGADLFSGPAELDAFLGRTDILVVLLPLTPETRGLLNGRLFSMLPTDGVLGPILINAGRGALAVEADILAALETGRLKGATLDVFDREPLPTDSPLWDHSLVTVTPHNAALGNPDVMADSIALQILRHAAGGPLDHVVSTGRGY